MRLHQKRQCLWPLFVIFTFRVPSLCGHDLAFTVVYRSGVPCKTGWRSASWSQEVCTMREPGQVMGGAQLATTEMA